MHGGRAAAIGVLLLSFSAPLSLWEDELQEGMGKDAPDLSSAA
jgi:hypothetical protein